jgi:DNA-binding response OmpR family regulator
LLLADGDAETRGLYASFLQRTVGEVEQAEEGREALAKALARPPHIVVAETRLAGINGFELCRLLREDEVTRGVPVLFVTETSHAEDFRQARAAGADAVLVKPCMPDRVGEEVRRLLAQSGQLRTDARNVSAWVARQIAKAQEVCARSEAVPPKLKSRTMERYSTTEPPLVPPVLVCICGAELRYVRSHIGGVSDRHREQWDYLDCPAGCGTYQYRPRTRKLRKV